MQQARHLRAKTMAMYAGSRSSLSCGSEEAEEAALRGTLESAAEEGSIILRNHIRVPTI